MRSHRPGHQHRAPIATFIMAPKVIPVSQQRHAREVALPVEHVRNEIGPAVDPAPKFLLRAERGDCPLPGRPRLQATRQQAGTQPPGGHLSCAARRRSP